MSEPTHIPNGGLDFPLAEWNSPMLSKLALDSAVGHLICRFENYLAWDFEN